MWGSLIATDTFTRDEYRFHVGMCLMYFNFVDSVHNTVYNDGGYDPNGLVGSANQVAKMRILEVGRNVKQVSEVKLGDELELRIDVNHPYSGIKYLCVCLLS